MTEPKPHNLVRRWRWTLLGLLLFGLFFGLIAIQLWFENSSRIGIGKIAPRFILETFDHGMLDTASLKGKVLLINFWGSWCTACHLEAEDLQLLWQRYQEDEVIFIGVAYLDTVHDARAYLEQYGIDYPNGLDTLQIITQQFQISGAPETFLVNRSGEIQYFQAGPINARILSREVEKALANNS